MTRPKVDPDKRQRTAQACDSCKRRKQKCNGLKPCNTCTRRNLKCSYTPSHQDHGSSLSPKRRHMEPPPPSAPPSSVPEASNYLSWDQSTKADKCFHDVEMKETNPGTTVVPSTMSPAFDTEKPTIGEADLDKRSRVSTISGGDDEAAVFSQPRMLQDSTGRLLYIGDSASLSYLQLIRIIVESIAGQSPFTLDPRRHRIMENNITLPPHVHTPQLLPDRQTADVLIESYFINTNGLIEAFDRQAFVSSVDACYSDPLRVEPSFLCLMYLTFAIGLVLATPMPGTREDIVVKRLRDESFDRAELFYRSAKCLADPVSGFEDADFWSVQALLLMSVYMLAVSKRNAAYAYYGMAVRSAFALGLHREETIIYSRGDLGVRRNLWRSLFVIDRFLSASLGRPTAIAEEDCSSEALKTPEHLGGMLTTPSIPGLEAAVRSCRVIGEILKKVYSKRKISTKVAQGIADHHKDWSTELHPSLHWKQATNQGTTSATQGIAILHVNLLYCHSIILLSRPFFLYMLTKVERERHSSGQAGHRISMHMEKFSEACVQASYHTIVLVQVAYENNYLPQRNPFVLYFLFAASLVVLSNEFAMLYHNASYTNCISNAISIMRYCSGTDPQAERLNFILTTFRDVVSARTSAMIAQTTAIGRPPNIHSLSSAAASFTTNPSATTLGHIDSFFHRGVMPTISISPSATFDPMSSFFTFQSHDAQTAQSHSHLPDSIPRISKEGSASMSSAGMTPTSTTRVVAAMSTSGPSGTGLQLLAKRAQPLINTTVHNGPINEVAPSSSAMAPGIAQDDSLASVEADIDFDSLWDWTSNLTCTTGPPGFASAEGRTDMSHLSARFGLGTSSSDSKLQDSTQQTWHPVQETMGTGLRDWGV